MIDDADARRAEENDWLIHHHRLATQLDDPDPGLPDLPGLVATNVRVVDRVQQCARCGLAHVPGAGPGQPWPIARPFLVLGQVFETIAGWWWANAPRMLGDIFNGLVGGVKEMLRRPALVIALVFVALFLLAFTMGYHR
jgi:hypothetical protein